MDRIQKRATLQDAAMGLVGRQTAATVELACFLTLRRGHYRLAFWSTGQAGLVVSRRRPILCIVVRRFTKVAKSAAVLSKANRAPLANG